jgi:hypothetical protein
MRTHSFLLGFAFPVAPPLWAQHLSGEDTCGNPEVNQQIPVGDRPDHSFSVSKNSCSWTKPFEMAGEQGHYLDRMSNGDTVHYRYEGVTKLKGETPQSVAWSWTFAGGSGKFSGLKGRGSCKGSWPGGVNRWSCTGTYVMGKK